MRADLTVLHAMDKPVSYIPFNCVSSANDVRFRIMLVLLLTYHIYSGVPTSPIGTFRMETPPIHSQQKKRKKEEEEKKNWAGANILVLCGI